MDKASFHVSTDKNKLNIDLIFNFLNKDAYWSRTRSYETVTKSIENSLCYGIYNNENSQVGFARVITDYAVYAYILDLFIIESYRRQGLGKQLMKDILYDPVSKMVRNWSLATRDAHGLYRQFGFANILNPERHMSMTRD